MKDIEKLSNHELQKLYAKDKARGKERVWEQRSHKDHLARLRALQEDVK